MKIKFRAAFLGKAVYGTSVILIGMAIRNFVQIRMPVKE